jgi:cell division protein FtsQ
LSDAAPLRTHPRIRERRVAVKRDEGLKRLRFLVGSLGVIALGAVAYGVTRSPLLNVDIVHVGGAVNTSPEAVARAAGFDRHPQLADVDPAGAAVRIEGLPWVEHATVVRHWPRSIEVTLLERSPLAALPAAEGGFAVVDATGRVLAIQPEAPPGMVTLTTPTPAPGAGADLTKQARDGLAVLEVLPESVQGRVRSVTVAEDGSLELVLDKAPLVRFGPTTQLRAKVVALETLLARTNLRGVRAIDVRVPTAPVLTRG